jgi:hypothetical protein
MSPEPRGRVYPRQISSALVIRFVVMTVVVVLLAVWLHLWWLALLYVGFWGLMVVIGSRRTRP